jgi:MoxR-like ATPase
MTSDGSLDENVRGGGELRRSVARFRAVQRALLQDVRRLNGDDAAHSARKQLAHRLEQASRSTSNPELQAEIPGADETTRALFSEALRCADDVVEHAESKSKRVEYCHWLDRRARVLRQAVHIRKAEQAARDLERQAQLLSVRASASQRDLLPFEHTQQAQLLQRAGKLRERLKTIGEEETAEDRDEIFHAVAQARVAEAKRQLDSGLMLTEQMEMLIDESVPSLVRGEPMLFIGETGGAKTALARYICERYLAGDAEIVSGYGDMTAAQLMGTYELRVVDGATESVFSDGPLPRAMKQGTALILDEINALPPEFLKRLNLILQLRPGDTYSLQENAGRELKVRAGFVVIATANEQTPTRYRGLERMSSELVNRFGANSYRVSYPDTDVKYDEDPRENTLLALAAAADRHGDLPRHISIDEISRAARAAFISQQVFAGSLGKGFDRYVSAEQSIDGRPGLEEAVLAPRTLVAVVQKAAQSGGAVSLNHAMSRFIASVMNPGDREVLHAIFSSQGWQLESANG